MSFPVPIAVHPASPRDHCRLMAVDRRSGHVQHLKFFQIVGLFNPGDCLVLNVSGVFPARILFEQGGKEGELLLQRFPQGGEAVPAKMQGRWAKRLAKDGRVRFIKGGEGSIEIVSFNEPEGVFLVRVHADNPLSELGEVPLPAYIIRTRQRAGQAAVEAGDREEYQTVYAESFGSLAAPTAGLHWTPQLLGQVEAQGIRIARLVLDIGFASTIRAAGLDTLPAESYRISHETAVLINETRKQGGRIIACGTSVVRTLESLADEKGFITSAAGSTDLFIKPGFRFRAVDALITNFHIPDSTHFLLTQAFLSSAHDLAAIYRQAIADGYRFYSYGDAMFIF